MLKKTLLALLLFISLANTSYAFSLPEHDNYVTDVVNVLSEEEEQVLEEKIYTIWKTTWNEIAVIIIPSTQWEDIAMLATDIGNTRWVGNKEFDNGIVILIAIEDRNRFTAVGYWLEGTLPDAITKRIGQKNFPDNFRQEQYYQWISSTLDDISWYILNDPTIKEYYEKEQYTNEDTNDKYDGIMFVLWVILAGVFLKGKKEMRKKVLLFLWLWWTLWTIFWLLFWSFFLFLISGYVYLLIGIVLTQGKFLWLMLWSSIGNWWRWWFWWWGSFWWFWWGSFWWWWSWWSR